MYIKVKSIILSIQIIIIFIPSIIINFTNELCRENFESAVYWISFFFVLQFFWAIWSWKKLEGSLLNPYIIFFICATLFNGAKAFLEVFNLNEFGIENFATYAGTIVFSFQPDIVLRSILLVSISMAALHLGAILAVKKKENNKKFYKAPSLAEYMMSRKVGFALLLISAIPLIIVVIEKYKVVLVSGYSGLFAQQALIGLDSWKNILSSLFIPGIFLLLAANNRKIEVCKKLSIIFFFYIGILWFTGTRLWWAMPLIAYIWLWNYYIKKISKIKLWALTIFTLFVVFPLTAIIRNIEGIARLSAKDYINAYFSIKNPIVSVISEIGGTLLVICHSIQLVPLVKKFDFGLSYLYGFLSLIPNLFWEIHPTANKLYSHWLTYLISPDIYYSGGGYGFSFIAEAYVNFGWICGPLILCIIGYFFVKIIWSAMKYNYPENVAGIATFMAFFLIFARGEFGLVARPIIWYCMIPSLLIKMLKKQKAILKMSKNAMVSRN